MAELFEDAGAALTRPFIEVLVSAFSSPPTAEKYVSPVKFTPLILFSWALEFPHQR